MGQAPDLTSEELVSAESQGASGDRLRYVRLDDGWHLFGVVDPEDDDVVQFLDSHPEAISPATLETWYQVYLRQTGAT